MECDSLGPSRLFILLEVNNVMEALVLGVCEAKILARILRLTEFFFPEMLNVARYSAKVLLPSLWSPMLLQLIQLSN